MAAPPILLLPPSEGKRPGGTDPLRQSVKASFPELDPHRLIVASALKAAMGHHEASRSKLLGVKGKALAAATETNLSVHQAPTMPAIDRYTGVLYDALDVGSLSTRDRKRLSKQVLIFSGLWGVLRPDDLIPDYKLKMGASLPPVGKLAPGWKHPVTDAISRLTTDAIVWDLLPKEHDAAWVPPSPGSTTGAPLSILTVKFLDEQKRAKGAPRTFTTVNHWNKLLKGALVRHVLATGADEPDALGKFTHPEGYRYDATLTETHKGRVIIAMVRPQR
jgi:hypothetical protein